MESLFLTNPKAHPQNCLFSRGSVASTFASLLVPVRMDQSLSCPSELARFHAADG
jgi:hypothetical protein